MYVPSIKEVSVEFVPRVVHETGVVVLNGPPPCLVVSSKDVQAAGSPSVSKYESLDPLDKALCGPCFSLDSTLAETERTSRPAVAANADAIKSVTNENTFIHPERPGHLQH